MTRQEEIADMAGKAGQLVKELERLKKHAEMYSSAQENLIQTRESLVQLIGETRGLATETHKVLGTLNEIGAGKIFERLAAIEDHQKRTDLSERFAAIEDRQKRSGTILVAGLLVLAALSLWLVFRAK